MTFDQASFNALFTTALLGVMALAALGFAKFYWRRNRVFSYCSAGLCLMLLDYMSNGGHFDALSHRVLLLTMVAVGLQIAFDGYRASRR
ncbi:hypothetical protein EFP18_21495 [Burkholderia glumae]|uniref:hypothetical protein n=1 Tax=Burkholderia glumae TaxID=337 RepID=UPI0020CB8883|nr:hypothetical protein [Burkholderia glumae]MCQ0031257.1 hypothetical protein [Burkholderia glumae]MCQ0038842.1 hypothetical protein [Burkholderia glumae]UVS86708.1 hypothetical protein EFP18_21495 [Burkholderia glumae]